MLKDIAEMNNKRVLDYIPEKLFKRMEAWALHQRQLKSVRQRGETFLATMKPGADRLISYQFFHLLLEVIKRWGSDPLYAEWRGRRTPYYEFYQKLRQAGVAFPKNDKYINKPEPNSGLSNQSGGSGLDRSGLSGPRDMKDGESSLGGGGRGNDYSAVMKLVNELKTSREFIEETVMNNNDATMLAQLGLMDAYAATNKKLKDQSASKKLAKDKSPEHRTKKQEFKNEHKVCQDIKTAWDSFQSHGNYQTFVQGVINAYKNRLGKTIKHNNPIQELPEENYPPSGNGSQLQREQEERERRGREDREREERKRQDREDMNRREREREEREKKDRRDRDERDRKDREEREERERRERREKRDREEREKIDMNKDRRERERQERERKQRQLELELDRQKEEKNKKYEEERRRRKERLDRLMNESGLDDADNLKSLSDLKQQLAGMENSKNSYKTQRNLLEPRLKMMRDQNYHLESERTKLASKNNDLAYRKEIVNASLIQKERDKNVLLDRLKRKQQELEVLKKREIEDEINGEGARVDNKALERLVDMKDTELLRYKEKYEKLQTDYKNYMLGKDPTGKEKAPFYRPSSPIRLKLDQGYSYKKDKDPIQDIISPRSNNPRSVYSPRQSNLRFGATNTRGNFDSSGSAFLNDFNKDINRILSRPV